MATESLINLTEGAGKKQHTVSRVVGANTVEDTIALIGEQYLASYNAGNTAAISFATANSHLFQVMAGASLRVYIRRIRVFQMVVATTAAFAQVQVLRLTTAGTGGTALTPSPKDPAAAASGHTFMTLPTVKGTEGVQVDAGTAQFTQTIATQAPGYRAALIFEANYDVLRETALIIAAGAANGICLKLVTAIAAATGFVVVDTSESNFT